MKVIKINESQQKRLFEAYREGFSFDELTAIADSAFADEDNSVPQMAYCRKWLGQPSFMGSSRAVFTLSDNIVLKLAYGSKYFAGIDQNQMEYELFERTKSPLLARVYDCDKNFTYLVCESVVPAESEDFEKIVGIPFQMTYRQNSIKSEDPDSNHGGDKTVGYNKYFGNNIKSPYEWTENHCLYDIFCYIEANDVLHENCFDIRYEREILNNKWLKNFRELIKEIKVGDFCKVNNFGIVNRDGKPNIVLLDVGLTIGVWMKHYK
jgi:hypothetical protein